MYVCIKHVNTFIRPSVRKRANEKNTVKHIQCTKAAITSFAHSGKHQS